MNSLSPALITLAVILPFLALTIGLQFWILRHRQPDAARIKVLRILLGIIFSAVLALLALLIIFGPDGIRFTSDLLLTLLALFLVALVIAYGIHSCQRRLGQKSPRS
jgi:uncharacterized membrane protein